MKFFWGILSGLGYGLLIAVCFFLLAIVLDILGCVCTCELPFTNYSCLNAAVYSCLDYDPATSNNNCTDPGVNSSDGWRTLAGDPDVGFWKWNTVKSVFGVCLAGGIVIGMFYGISKQAQENEAKREKERQKVRLAEIKRVADENERLNKEKAEREAAEKAIKVAELKQRQGYATEYKRKYNSVLTRCESYKQTCTDFESKLSPNYQSVEIQGKLWGALNEMSTPLQRLVNIVNDLEIKEDI